VNILATHQLTYSKDM